MIAADKIGRERSLGNSAIVEIEHAVSNVNWSLGISKRLFLLRLAFEMRDDPIQMTIAG